jgi:hypothetical protein
MSIREDLEDAAVALETGHATEDEPEILGQEKEESSEEDLDHEAPEEDVSHLDEEPAAQPAAVEEDDAPPTTWSAEMREHWRSTPKSVRDYVHRREKQQHDYISRTGHELGQLRKEYQDVEKALKPYEEQLKQAGVSKGSVIARMIQERETMSSDPRAFIKEFADRNKLDLLDLAMDEDQATPPSVRQARYDYERQRAEVEAQRREIESQQVEIQKTQVVEFVESWGATKPHFQQVRQAMAQVLPEIQQSYAYLSFPEQLDATYNAVMRHPNFQHLTNAVTPAVKKAAAGLNGNSGVPSRSPEANSIREALMQAAKETGYF